MKTVQSTFCLSKPSTKSKVWEGKQESCRNREGARHGDGIQEELTDSLGMKNF